MACGAVHILQHDILKRDTALVRKVVAAKNIAHLLNRVGILYWHNLTALLREGVVQRHCKVHLRLIEQSGQVLRHTRCRDGDACRRPRQAPLRGEDVERAQKVVDIIQRLAHTHKDKVGEPIAFRDRDYLVENLGGRELMTKAHTPRSAKFAPHTATRLRRYTEGHTLTIGDKRRLDIFALRCAEEVLFGAIRRCRYLERCR